MIPEALDYKYSAEFREADDSFSLILTKDSDSCRFDSRKYGEAVDYPNVMLKSAMLRLYKKDYKWGGLIGVRPTKVYRKFLGAGLSHEEIKEILINVYLVSLEKALLLETIIKKELEYLNRDHINVYIGIPYCPTKCRYCSFASYEIKGKQGEAYDSFVETLLEEIRLSGEFLSENFYSVESIYMGGGTPTILNEKDLSRVLSLVNEVFEVDKLKEFTVEAGRIDTLNKNKLSIMKENKVGRISINPQTFNEEILKDLNRYFDRKEFDSIYSEAKSIGFIVNIDLIIGLPNETTEDIIRTISQLESYEIDNLTIHVLALKKASHLFKEGYKHNEIDYEKINRSIKELTEKKDLLPYYMYRQKNSLDWGENVGYSLEGKESVFNIEMIEENQSTFGIGGGAISKRIQMVEDDNRDQIDRVVNPKEPIAYIKEMRNRLEKKIILFKR